MPSPTLASKSAARPGAAEALQQVGAFLRSFWAATPAAILIDAISSNLRRR